MSLDSSIFNKNAFPWVASTAAFDAAKTYPKVSVVVPSYNQGFYLEETLLSIIRQNYPNLELIVIDGGSTDDSVEVIKKYENYITYWVSEKDRGQSHAINKGFEQATGEWVAWMNSDDCYLEGAFKYVFEESEIEQYDFIYGSSYTFASLSKIEENILLNDSFILKNKMKLYNLLQFFQSSIYIIPSQSVFIHKNLISKAGILDERFHFCMDLEWYARFSIQNPRVKYYDKIISFFRINESTKTGTSINRIPEEALEVANTYCTYLRFWEKVSIKWKIIYFKKIRIYMLSNTNSVLNLALIFITNPWLANRDPRFKTLVKSALAKK